MLKLDTASEKKSYKESMIKQLANTWEWKEYTGVETCKWALVASAQAKLSLKIRASIYVV